MNISDATFYLLVVCSFLLGMLVGIFTMDGAWGGKIERYIKAGMMVYDAKAYQITPWNK